MLILSSTYLYFSPTGTTKQILEGVARGINSTKTEFINLCNSNNEIFLDKNKTDLVVIGMPTYISRIPPEAADLLKKLHGDGIPVVLIAVYGNNKFGDILLEMKHITMANGFVPIAAAAFIGEHSFSTHKKPIAANRPDTQDLNDAKDFGEQIKEQIAHYETVPVNIDLNVPGNFPYREWQGIAASGPTTDESLCLKCYQCKTACPVNAIEITETIVTNSERCIYCCACVRQCPVAARELGDEKIQALRERLHNTCAERKAPEIFV